MHPAPIFRTEDVSLIADHLRHYPLATLTAALGGSLCVAQTPVLMREIDGRLVLDFHLSRTNALADYGVSGFEAVAVSLGPEAYISPDWYVSGDQVPTWNYVSVEAAGPVSLLDNAELIALLDDLSAQEEAKLTPKSPWTRAKMSPGRFDAMTRAIVGARLTMTRLEATYKLSQNKAEPDRAGVIAALGDHPIVGAMTAHK
ncbi:MAG: transcriptional regulator [Phenylobacterium zucineum]|nr:MAG: transcriptional regulator [Phenylobacterium zucineum]